MIVNHRGTRSPGAEVGEPHVILCEAAFTGHVDAVLQPPEIGVHIVGAESELDSTLLRLPDNVFIRNKIASADLKGNPILLHHVQDSGHPLGSPHLVEPVVQEVREEERVGEYVRRLIGEDLDSLVNDQVHVFLVGQPVGKDLLIAVDPGEAAFLVDDGHSVREQIVKSSEGFGREVRGPFAALSLDSAQERHVLNLIEIFIDFLVIRQHPAHSTGSGVGSDTIVDAIVHAHRMGHLGGQATLKMDMPVDDREVFLLETDGLVRGLINRRQCVGGIHGVSRQALETQVPETDRPMAAKDADLPMAKKHL